MRRENGNHFSFIAMALATVTALLCSCASSNHSIAPIDPTPKAVVWHMGMNVDISIERIFKARLAALDALLRTPDMSSVDCYIAPVGGEYVVIWLIPTYDYKRLKDKLAPFNKIISDILFGAVIDADKDRPNQPLERNAIAHPFLFSHLAHGVAHL